VTDAVIGLALDGAGLGADGSVWGGELLRVDGVDFERIGHLTPLPQPGGENVAREPWRMAAAALHCLGRGDEIVTRFAQHAEAGTVRDMLRQGCYCDATASMGRLFDAAAGLLGVCEVQKYEGHAPMWLESLAERYFSAHALISPLHPVFPPPQTGEDIKARKGKENIASQTFSDEGSSLDFLPLLAKLADCKDPAYGAAFFHATVAAGLSDWVLRAARRHRIQTIALGGGCFLNAILADTLTKSLSAQGLRVLRARRFPPNDGALAFGQAVIALRRFAKGARYAPHPLFWKQVFYRWISGAS
jgi:hydrogenase maturation protein HypF